MKRQSLRTYAALLLVSSPLILHVSCRHDTGVSAEPSASVEAARPPIEGAGLAEIQGAIARREYRASESSHGLQAPNRAHRLRSYFEPTGVRIVERIGSGNPDLVELHLDRWGREGALAPASPGKVSHDGPQVEIAHPGIQQWFINGPEGLEQGFTLDERVAGTGALVVDIAVTGADVRESEDGLAFHSRTGRRLRYEKLYAEDAAGNALPSRMIARAGGLRIEVDDLGATYPILIDPLLTGDFDAEIDSNQQDAALGSHVSGAGDVNADGFADVLVGAEYYDEGETDEGAVFLFLGGPDGTGDGNPVNADAVFQSNLTNARMQKGEAAGDVNGDGYGDIIIGCNRCDNGQLDEGVALLFLGSATGIAGGSLADADTLLESDAANSYFARNVAAAGDVNGDGYGDVLIGQAGYSNGEFREGAAFVFHGSASGIPDGTSASADTLIESNNIEAELGFDVSGAGDVNADGYADIIIGAADYDTPAFVNTGAAFVFHGSATGIMSTDDPWNDANSTVQPKQSGTSIAVSAAGDTNGDGYGDVLVGFPNYDDGTSFNSGIALLVEGGATGLPDAEPGVDSSRLEALGFSGERAGASVAAAGDVNGDGYGDVLIGVPNFGSLLIGASGEGTVLVFLGRDGGIPNSLGASAYQAPLLGQSNAHLGTSVAGAGDINGDGYDDVIFGAPDYDGPQTNEGQAFVFHGGAQGIESGGIGVADAFLESGQNQAWLGSSVASAGDINGDGYGDIIIGARRYDAGEGSEGAAFIFLGDPNGIADGGPASAHAQLESDQSNALFGYSVASAGDVNGDGYGDVIVSAAQYDDGQVNEGGAFIFLGGPLGIPDGDLASAHAQITTDQAGAQIRRAASAGDVNGDGFGDVILGSLFYDDGEFREGLAAVFLGSASGISSQSVGSADARLTSDQASALFGSDVASAGDVNGDGYGDVIIAAPDYDDGLVDQGAAFVYLGSPSGLSDGGPGDAHAQWVAEIADAHLGSSVSAAGDVNGDGYGDVIVGATQDTRSYADEGSAYIFHGSATGLASGTTAVANKRIDGFQTGARLGQVAGAGDTNGDGYADVLVGARRYDSGQVDEGVALLFLGSPNGIIGRLPSSAAAQLESDQDDAAFGFAVAAAGDTNGDGFGDLLVGAPFYETTGTSEGAAFLYLGSPAGRPVLASQLRNDGSGLPIPPSAAPADATEFAVELFATSPRGREFAKLEVELCASGIGFGDAACSVETSANWVDLSTTGAFLSHDLTGLTPHTTYNWRARVLYRPVFATPTPVLRVGAWRRLEGASGTSDIRVVPEPGIALALGLGAVLVSALRPRRKSAPGFKFWRDEPKPHPSDRTMDWFTSGRVRTPTASPAEVGPVGIGEREVAVTRKNPEFRLGPRKVVNPPAPGSPWAYATLLLISALLIGFGQLEETVVDPPSDSLPAVSSEPAPAHSPMVWAGSGGR